MRQAPSNSNKLNWSLSPIPNPNGAELRHALRQRHFKFHGYGVCFARQLWHGAVWQKVPRHRYKLVLKQSLLRSRIRDETILAALSNMKHVLQEATCWQHPFFLASKLDANGPYPTPWQHIFGYKAGSTSGAWHEVVVVFSMSIYYKFQPV